MMKVNQKYHLLTILLIVLTSCGPKPHPWNGSPYQDPEPAPEVLLHDTQGREFKLSEQLGKVVLLFFGYTYCPDVCPSTVADMSWVFDQLGGEADRVIFGFITVDPERDTPEVLESYLERHHAKFYGLRGDQTQLESIKEAYGVYAEKDSQDSKNYLITHTARIFLIDTGGILRTNYSFGTYPEEILADVQYSLNSEE